MPTKIKKRSVAYNAENLPAGEIEEEGDDENEDESDEDETLEDES